ncbi:MAG: hypothetical protein ACQERJ_01995 [Bacillota bacterium]
MQFLIVIYLAGIIFNIFFAIVYWYKNRMVLNVNYQGAVVFILLSWLIYPLVVFDAIVRR